MFSWIFILQEDLLLTQKWMYLCLELIFLNNLDSNIFLIFVYRECILLICPSGCKAYNFFDYLKISGARVLRIQWVFSNPSVSYLFQVSDDFQAQ